MKTILNPGPNPHIHDPTSLNESRGYLMIIIIIIIIIIIDSFSKAQFPPKTKFMLNGLYIAHGITDINYFNTYTHTIRKPPQCM